MFAAGTEAMPESYRFDTVKGDWFRQDREVVMDKRIAIVTGSALGLGYELTRQLIERGWFVCGVDFNAAKQQELAEAFGSDRYRALTGDISDEAFVRAAVAEAASIGHIDLLINNAGQPSFKVPTAYTAADVDKCLKGLKGMILFSVETLKADGERDLKIANVMSTAATRGNANESVYCATKWGERGYTESLKAAYKGTSVKIVGVCPGGIDTEFYRDSHDYVSEEKQHTFMSPADCANVILFNLVNDANLTVSDILIERNYV
ncbi:short-chain dehydrogenase/reductase SDR [Bifidobacterium pullorum subsp. gallinarum]|uniref:Short-chain dehydrogenase/reductase SDR n=2 Tax=Bifidobacterium pullorum TaxID=78448 RepID=A0A087AQQ8_9BIFI|nr:short-chain dehydrogenase/reductase SDR [Bifidobacterium pullorum subsp. gallinarum]